MESTTDFEKLLLLYKTEGHNMSIESFCIHNGVNYKAFDRWYRDTHKNIVPVQVVGESDPVEENHEEVKAEELAKDEARISVSMYLGNGFYVKRKHLTYAQLKSLVEKLESLC